MAGGFVEQCSSHFQIMTTIVLTGRFRNFEIHVTYNVTMFCNNQVAKLLEELFAFTHHEMFLVWHLANKKNVLYSLSICTNPDINMHRLEVELLSNYLWILAGSLPFLDLVFCFFFVCSILFSCVIQL